MQPLYVYTIFDNKSGKPRCTAIKDGDKTHVIELFKGSGGNIGKIFGRINKISKIIVKSEYDRPVVISDYKRHIESFSLPITSRRLNVYDMHLPNITHSDVCSVCSNVVEKMSCKPLREYQKLIANAAVVYHDIEKRGLLINHIPHFPKWSMDTYSGRSKTTGVNIQGWTDDSCVRTPPHDDKDVMVHFDWVCADIRVASLLSNDQLLQRSFDDGDPYKQMVDLINAESEDKITRDEAKLFFLKSINSMDSDSLSILKVYGDLENWIIESKKSIESPDGSLSTILGRKFKLAGAKNALAVLNGAMQGSVAHAMHNVIRSVWEKFPHKVVAEVHDSLITCTSSNKNELLSTISAISDIMLYPFDGLIDSNPAFPVKVSIGKKWKKWQPYLIKRANGVEYVKEGKGQKEATPSEEG